MLDVAAIGTLIRAGRKGWGRTNSPPPQGACASSSSWSGAKQTVQLGKALAVFDCPPEQTPPVQQWQEGRPRRP